MGFDEATHRINGVDTVVLSAGAGEPLVFLHGAGTAGGFDALLPLAERFRLIVPIHPGFGGSADDPRIDEVHDYRRHYLDLFDALGLDRLVLAGHSLGGYIAATLAIDHPERITRLVLAAPIGLRVREHPTTDVFTIPAPRLAPYLTEKPELLAAEPTPEFLAERYRELTSAARLLWTSPYDRKLPDWLHRARMPALLLWGDADRLIPVGQCAAWAGLLPNAERHILPGVGHLMFGETPDAVAAVARFAEASVPA